MKKNGHNDQPETMGTTNSRDKNKKKGSQLVSFFYSMLKALTAVPRVSFAPSFLYKVRSSRRQPNTRQN